MSNNAAFQSWIMRINNKKTIKNYKNPGGKNNNANLIKELAFC